MTLDHLTIGILRGETLDDVQRNPSRAEERCTLSAAIVQDRDRVSVSEDRMAAAEAMLTAIFSHAADRSGLKAD